MTDEEMLAREKMGERLNYRGEQEEEENNNPEAERWASAMSGETGEPVPPYAGVFDDEAVMSTERADLGHEAMEDGAELEDDIESELELDQDLNDSLSGANRLTNYGFNTAARIYGFAPVIKTILEIDETDRNVENPLGDIYARLAPTPEDRAFLYGEIRKERPREDKHNTPALAQPAELQLGFTPYGNFYDKTENQPNHQQASIDAIQALRHLVELLETHERFAEARERAAEQGKSVIEYLIGDENNPTFTDFFNRVSISGSDDELVEAVAELEEQVEPESEDEEGANTIMDNPEIESSALADSSDQSESVL